MKKPQENKRRGSAGKPQASTKAVSPEKADAEPMAIPPKKQKLTVQETCELIAELSESVLEDPEQAFTSTEIDRREHDGDEKDRKNTTRGPSKMQQLLMLANQQATDSEQYTAQLAIMSLLAIFKDILPAYRIRVPTAQEMAVKVSKETKKMWDHERALLHHYQQYLKLLEKTWEKQNSSVSVTALLSLAELLKTAFHFNFRSNLLAAVVRQMNNSKSEPVRTACCESIKFVFANDAQGEVALEAARQVAKLVKDRSFKVHPAVLRTFLALPLRVHVDEAVAAKLASQANAKKRKRDRETADIEAEMREGKATVDKIILARCQSDTLQAVTLTYFRVLKSDNLTASHIEDLLPPALEGLAKIAHLINIDTVMDLLGVLRDLLKKVDTLPVDAALNCILTAFQTLQGPGKEMKIDQKEYILPLYSQLPRLCIAENSMLHTDIMIQCLTAAFVKRREYSTVRVAAFLKQILTTAMHTPPHTAIPLITFARQLIQRYPSAEQMLENEQDVITEGEYTPDVEDPEHANPFATSAWELATLKFHLHMGISTQAVAAASSKMLNLPGESPEKLRASTLQEMDELYIPFQRIKKKHPLYSRQSENNEKQKRNQVRFITPRAHICLIAE
jgi:nucleolar complex protein 3